MKLSTVILLTTFLLLLVAMVMSNILLKKQYDQLDKSNLYWNYEKLLGQPFSHLKIEGGNLTNIAFEQNEKASIQISKNWRETESSLVKAHVYNDTLFVKFPLVAKDAYEKEYLRRSTMVRIFSPHLWSVEGFNTNFTLYKLKQKSISVCLSGKSNVVVEMYLHDLDTLRIKQQDSSRVVFRMSPELENKSVEEQPVNSKAPLNVQKEPLHYNNDQAYPDGEAQPVSWETLHMKYVDANIQGVSILDLGHAQIHILHLNISDTSAIILSGGGLKKLK